MVLLEEEYSEKSLVPTVKFSDSKAIKCDSGPQNLS